MTALVRIPRDRASFARRISGLSLKNAARILGLTWEALNAIETGDCSTSPGVLLAMTAAYDCDARWLAGETPELLTPVSGPAVDIVRQVETKIADPGDRIKMLRSLACIGVL